MGGAISRGAWAGARRGGPGLAKHPPAHLAQDWPKLSRHRPGRPGARAWAGPSREKRGAGGAGLGLGLISGLGLVMLWLGRPAELGLRPRDGKRAGGREGAAAEPEVSLGGRGRVRRQVS